MLNVFRSFLLHFVALLLIHDHFQMFRAIAILASIVGASAFAPAGRMAVHSSLKMGYENEVRYSYTCRYPLSNYKWPDHTQHCTLHLFLTCIIYRHVLLCKQFLWPNPDKKTLPFFPISLSTSCFSSYICIL